MPPRPALATLAAGISLVHGELVEVTDRGTASQSSEWNGGQFPAARAMDGNPATFSHTDGTTPNNAWTLHLDRDHEIGRVEIAMRADCCGGRLTGATARLFDGEGDSVFDEVISDPGPGGVVIINLPAATPARTLRIGFEDGATNPGGATTYLHLGEVRIFAEVDLRC